MGLEPFAGPDVRADELEAESVARARAVNDLLDRAKAVLGEGDLRAAAVAMADGAKLIAQDRDAYYLETVRLRRERPSPGAFEEAFNRRLAMWRAEHAATAPGRRKDVLGCYIVGAEIIALDAATGTPRPRTPPEGSPA